LILALGSILSCDDVNDNNGIDDADQGDHTVRDSDGNLLLEDEDSDRVGKVDSRQEAASMKEKSIGKKKK
jgi:hypothetical protein